MAYEKVGWVNYPQKKTMTSAENFGHMDDGIYNNDKNIGDISKISDIGDGTLAGAILSHVEDIGNPHNTTKEQVGLGNVPNVATNNQTPTYTVATATTGMISGEKLSTAFGKIAKVVNTFITKTILNNTNRGPLGYIASSAVNQLITASTLAFWNGAYTGTTSNLAYCLKGEFGDAVTKNVDTAPVNGGINLITSGAVYELQEQVDECFQSVSDGKALVASAITGKGVITASDAAFKTMANNISAISTGKCIALGEGTSFNVKTICANNGIDYTKLTKDNFIFGITDIQDTQGDYHWTYEVGFAYVSKGYGCKPTLSYNASTGLVTVSGNEQILKIMQLAYPDREWSQVTQTMTVSVWLIVN